MICESCSVVTSARVYERSISPATEGVDGGPGVGRSLCPNVGDIIVGFPRLRVEEGQPLHYAVRRRLAINIIVRPSRGHSSGGSVAAGSSRFTTLIRQQLSVGRTRQPCIVGG